MNAAELAASFRIPGVIEFAETPDGLVKVVVSRAGMTGELFLQGAQVTAWQPAGARPVIFLSSHSHLAPGKAIRGGIPLVFPWFGPHPTDPRAPQHGLVRTAPWTLDSAREVSDGVTLGLSLTIEHFTVNYHVAFGPELNLAFTTLNNSDDEVSFEQALHSYWAVSDVERVAVAGLENSGHIDKTANMRSVPPAGAPLTLAKETDSVYRDTPARLVINDPGWGRRIVIDKTGAASAIVWNPFPEKAAALADLGTDNWRGFVCVETGNVADHRVILAAGAEHQLTTRISLDGG